MNIIQPKKFEINIKMQDRLDELVFPNKLERTTIILERSK